MYDLTLIGLPISLLTEERVSSLILEGKDPLEVLTYKFQQIPKEIIQQILDIDPTKKKSYSQWLCTQWDKESNLITKSLQNGRIKEFFEYLRTHPKVQIKDAESLKKALDTYVPHKPDPVLDKSTEPTTYIENIGYNVDSSLANDYDVVFNNDGWLIAVPNTYEAECKLGENMKWCTANAFGNGKNWYNQYLRDYGGKYYVLFNLDRPQKSPNGIPYPYTRYQFHFESNQFMDKNDSRVSFEDIELPQSIYDFFTEEGYNMDNYGISEEEKMERYDNQRWQDSIRIFDDLYLNQAYDDDYEYTEPNESTDFYVFDTNDDRDPIDWIDLPNTQDVIQYKNEDTNIAILRKKRDGYLIVYKDPTSRGYRDWTLEECAFFSVDGDKIVAYVDDDKHSGVFFTDGKHLSRTDTPNRHYEKLFINTNTPKDHLCVELIDDEHFHTLIELSPESRLIVPLDVPINEKQFQIDENGYILAQYRKYPFFRETEMQNSDDVNFQIEKQLTPGRLLVSMPSEEENVECTYNVLDAHNKKFVCPFNFDRLFDSRGYAYVVEYDGEYFVVSLDGEQIGGTYDNVQYIELPNYIYGVSQQNGADIIDLTKRSVIAKCKNIDLHFGRMENSIIQLNYGNGIEKLFDYKTQEWILPEYNRCIRLDTHILYEQNQHIFLIGIKEGEDNYTLLEYYSNKTFINNIQSADRELRKSKSIKLTFSDGSKNLFDTNSLQLVLPQNVIDIDTSESCDQLGIFPYKTQPNKQFFYNIKTHTNIINPNGIDRNLIRKYFVNDSTAHIAIQTNNDLTFVFSINNKQDIEYKKPNSYYYDPISQAQNNPEVLQTISQITGQDYTQPIKENLKRQFNNILKALH